jgi:hypothetical protein
MNLVLEMGEILEACAAKGMRFPFIMVAVSPNGSVKAMRCLNADMDGDVLGRAL